MSSVLVAKARVERKDAAPVLIGTLLGADLYFLRAPRCETERAVRKIVATYARLAPEAIFFVRGSHGKPALAPLHLKRVWFNLSRANHHLLVAVSTGGEVGVDIEDLARPIDVAALKRRALSTLELAALRDGSHADRRQSLVQYWCRKEAVLKAAGFGFSIQPDLVEVASRAGRASGESMLTTPTGILPMIWHDIDLRCLNQNLVAALAIRAHPSEIDRAGTRRDPRTDSTLYRDFPAA